MLDPANDLRQYLQRLVNRFLNTRSMCIQLEHLACWSSPSRREVYDRGSHFFDTVSYSLVRLILVELAMLISNKEERSLVDWLRKAKTYAGQLRPTRYNPLHEDNSRSAIDQIEYTEIIDSNLRQIVANQHVIDRIRAQRDKFITHLDSKYFDHPDTIRLELPFSVSDTNQIMNLVKEILELHYAFLFETDLDITLHSARNLDAVLSYTRAFMRIWDDMDLLQAGFQPGKYLIDEYPSQMS